VRTVAVDILTGFLGSGKTTLLRHVLQHGLQGQRVAVVMNELGDVGIDGRVVTGLSAVEKMVELSSGCLCCTIDDYRFDVAIQEIIDTGNPHLIIIESTGVAYPEPLVRRVLAAGLGLDAIVTLVDAADVERHLAESAAVRAQIEAADFLVLNKTDLVGAAALDRTQRRLARLNPRAAWVRAERGAVDARLLFATGVGTLRSDAAQPGAHHEPDGIETVTYRSARPLDQRRFERVLGGLPRAILRAKGVVRLAGRDRPCLFNYTCGRWDLDWLPVLDVAESQAVFIGRHLTDHAPRLRERLRACEVEDSTAQAGVPPRSDGQRKRSKTVVT
jgi:G3E family GTPase